VRRGEVVNGRSKRADAGFSLIEQIIAMVVIVGVLLGLLSTLGATARGVTTGRQRTIAVSLSKQVIEKLQGAAYSDVAMNQATLTADALVLGVTPNLRFDGELLVLGGPTAAPYRTLTTAVGTTFSLRTFVTGVAAAGAGYRRTTVIVDWPSVSPTHTLRLSSLVFPLD
jgi:type II secretory pathway pseudopilin PulG